MVRIANCLILSALLARGASQAAFEGAIRAGDEAALERELASGAPLNGPLGLHTPLTLAIVSGKPKIAGLLLKHGALRSAPYGGPDFSRAAVPKGKKFWTAQCESCHRLESTGARIGPELHALQSFANVVDTVTNGSGRMPAFKSRMSRNDINAVSSYLLASLDPLAGLTPYEIGLFGCHRESLVLLTPIPRLLPSPARIRITTYAESMEQMVRLKEDLCLAEMRFGGQPEIAPDIEASRVSMEWLLKRWQRYAPLNWQPGNYDLIWPQRASALEALQPQDKRAAQVIQGLRRDLDLAVDDCRESALGMGTVRQVNVLTMRGAQPESGWQVFFKLKILEGFPDIPGQPFPNLSSPATWKLPPGNYLFYSKRQKQVSDTMPVTVDRRTNEGTQWQLPLP